MNKRTLLILASAFLILGAYPTLLHTLYPDYYKKTDQQNKLKEVSKGTPSAELPEAISSIAGTIEPAAALSSADDLTLATGKVNLTFTKVDGSIRLLSFPSFAHANGKPLELFSRATSGAGPGSVFFIGLPESAPHNVSIDVQGQQVITQGQSSDGRFRFQQTTVWDGYAAKVLIAVENTTDADQKLVYAYNLGETIPARNSIDSQYHESNFYERYPENKNKLVHVKAPKVDKVISSAAAVEWAAVKDRHFAVAAKPSADDAWAGRVRGLSNNRSMTMLVSPETILAPHGRIERELTFYVGPVELDSLTSAGLETLVNFGKLDSIGRLLVGALEMIHKLVRNWGVAIILLTISINLMLFPLTRASFLSMKRMQDVQPQMNRLREQYKGQPEKLNKETMELYKKHKVNPFGGCLPMLLQMPVFIALYVALSKSVMLINSKFLWVHDLSAPDRVSLPFSLPMIGNEIHVLPLIMSVGMAVQQRFSQMPSSNQDPAMAQQQKMMGVMMPIIFCFIFYSMPSGLVLYWLTNTVLMTTYQAVLKRTSPAAR